MAELSFINTWYWFLLGAVISYFIGCFNFAVLISHIKKSDIRNIGSGNPGTMNMTRTFGLKVGLINFFCDAFKGMIPVFAGYLIFKGFYFEGTEIIVSDFARFFFGLFAVIGHVFPVTMKFKGGKGIATTLGLFWAALSCEEWWLILVAFVFLLGIVAYIALTEWGSMGSLIGVSGLSVWQGLFIFFRYQSSLQSVYVIIIFMLILSLNLLTWLAHNKNLIKLLAGEEHRTSILGKIKNKLKKS
ncbi:MAG: glycerol-3-phosphate acyltransferase [Clostridiales bacterium]|nr:glycerol-3-phosphate acyltransferase [Clostridiales bacterium]